MIRKKPYLYKRIIAYVIDLLAIVLLTGIITAVFIDSTKYDQDNSDLIELTQKITSGEITKEEYNKEFNEINYQLNNDSKEVTIVTIGITIIYYTVMTYFCHGITIGKYIMKIRITGANGNELNIFNYLLRSLIANSLLSNVVTIILIYSLSKENYIKIYPHVSNFFTVLIVATFILLLYRKDGRGLHDLLGNTIVVDTNEEKKETEEVQEVKIIKEKKKKESEK